MITTRLIFAILLAVSFLPDAPLQAAPKIAPVPLASIPIEFVNNRTVIHIPVAHYHLHMVLDTGASSTALFVSNEHDFSDLVQTGKAKILFPALDEIVEGQHLAPIPIKFGEHIYTTDSLLLINQRPPIGDRLNFKFDGVLGQDFFAQYVVEINPQDYVLRLYPKGTNLSRLSFSRIKLYLKNGAPYIRFNHKFPWEIRGTTKKMLLDTGFPGLMIIWNKRHFSQAVGKSNVAAYKAENKGVFTRATFQVGELKFFNAPIFIAANIPRQAQKRDGLIGANVLNQLHHVIDFPNKQLLLGVARLGRDRIDGHFYVPNNEDYVYKHFTDFEATSKFVVK
jgi:predicted aspartyl protease